ncbi:hypothetical protein [Streptomyces bacillaris]|uniref:hypothetical protein n=1 Tax=Streptomyces bacillaris TaxID=68179 RepID=UPI00382BAF7C
MIFDRPCREAQFDPVDGDRYTRAGEAACVHPGKIGLVPDRTAAPREPSPAAALPPRRTPLVVVASFQESGRRRVSPAAEAASARR